MASIGPALTDAIYTAQVSPVLATGTPNRTFSLDLSSLTNWPSTDTAFTLLTDKTQLTTNLDTISNPLSAFPSTFNYFTANADGSNVVSLDANLTSVTATAHTRTGQPHAGHRGFGARPGVVCPEAPRYEPRVILTMQCPEQEPSSLMKGRRPKDRKPNHRLGEGTALLC